MEDMRLHGAPNAGNCKRHRDSARQSARPSRLVEHRLYIGANPLVNDREGLCPGAVSIFDGGTDHAAGIGDEVRQDEHAASGVHLLGFFRDWNIGTLRHEPCLEPIHIGGRDDVRSRRRYPDIAWNVDDGILGERLAAGVIFERTSFGLQGQEGGSVQSIRRGDRSMRVARRDENGALSGEETSGVLSDGAEALHGDPCALEIESDLARRHVDCTHQSEAGRPYLVERDADGSSDDCGKMSSGQQVDLP